jgi:hypothetical protein
MNRVRTRALLSVPLLAFLGVMAGCVSAPPSNKFVIIDPTWTSTVQRINSVAIIGDVCLVRDVINADDYVCVADSRGADSLMLASAKASMEQKGYRVPCLLAPFVGSFKLAGKTEHVAREKGAEVTERVPPFYVEASLAGDAEYQEALRTVLTQTVAAVGQKKLPRSEVFGPGAAASAAVIAQRTKADAALILVGNGVLVPGAKSNGQACLTGCATSIMTLGMFTYMQSERTFLDSYVALVDLSTGSLVWSNSGRLVNGNPTEPDYYTKRWAQFLLYHLPMHP